MAAHKKNCPKKIPSDVFRTKGEGSQFVQTTLPMTSLMCQTSLKSPVNWVALIMMAIKVENMMQDWNKSVQTTAFKPPYKWKIVMHYLKGYIEIDVSNKQTYDGRQHISMIFHFCERNLEYALELILMIWEKYRLIRCCTCLLNVWLYFSTAIQAFWWAQIYSSFFIIYIIMVS